MNIFSLTGIERLHEDEANVDFVSKRRITRHQVGFYTTLETAEAAMRDWRNLVRHWGWSIFGCEITEHALDEKVKGGEKASKEKIEALNRKVDELIAAYRAIETSSVRARQKGLRGGDGGVVSERSSRSETGASRITSNGDLQTAGQVSGCQQSQDMEDAVEGFAQTERQPERCRRVILERFRAIAAL